MVEEDGEGEQKVFVSRKSEPSNWWTTFNRDLMAGALMGVAVHTIVAPIERAKLLLQTQESNIAILSGPHRRFKGMFDCIIRTVKEEGVLSLWRGNGSSVLRYYPSVALNFSLKQSRSTAFNFFRTRDFSRMVERVWFEEFSMEKNLGKWRDLERLLRMKVETSATCGWYFRHSGHAAVKGEERSANVKRYWSPCSDCAHFTLSHLGLPSLKGSLALHLSNISPSPCHFTLHVAGYILYSTPFQSLLSFSFGNAMAISPLQSGLRCTG